MNPVDASLAPSRRSTDVPWPPGPAAGRAAFDVIVIGASAGGLVATTSILRDLPADLAVPVVVMLHLPADSNVVSLFERLPFDVGWLEPGSALGPRKLLVCPPRAFVELLPDGTCRLSPCLRGAIDKPIDRLFDSVARSFGPRAIGVILSGMGSDGAKGAGELQAAGGRVLVQSEGSAEHGGMPGATIGAGAADLIVPLQDMAQVIADIVAGTQRPKLRSETAAVESLFAGGGTARAQLRAVDWGATPLGPVAAWPPVLRSAVRTALASRIQMVLYWGPQHVLIANDAYLPSLGDKPPMQGRPAREVWPDVWSYMGRELERVARTGEATLHDEQLWPLHRRGFVEETYFSYSYSPLHDEAGNVAGVLATSTETTARVLADRRIKTLRSLGEAAAGAATMHEACTRAVAALGDDPNDLPFALVYQFDKSRGGASLVAATGVAAGSAAAPHWIDLRGDDAAWPLARVMEVDRSVAVADLATRFAGALASPWPEATQAALVVPLHRLGGEPPMGAFVAGLSPRLPLDDRYRDFVDLVAARIGAIIAAARTRERERERLGELAELDRAKTEFFANVSHEFRTPLTLMLAPLDNLLRQRDALPAGIADDVDVSARNARRLLGLVDDLLDFSQIESRRHQPAIEPVDLAAATADVASAFRSAIETAGLTLRIDCSAHLPPVPVNLEMWSKIVSNLLSNAFKFTFEGAISVTLRPLSLHAELVISDTGIGIDAAELPHIFKRFHRVRGARARTAEGSGIGLAMVDDLVRRMGGQVRVQSRVGRGTEFTVWMPYKRRPGGKDVADAALEPAAAVAVPAGEDLAGGAARWLAGAPDVEPEGIVDELLGPPREAHDGEGDGRIVVVDDNADMRHYLRRLFAPRWQVELACDGIEALEAIRRVRPDVVVADVMMPNLDGFALLQRLRDDPALADVPVVLLTARAGEETAIEGLLAGADDCIAKPFSPRELVARVRAVAERARVEAALRTSERRLQARNDELERFAGATADRELRIVELEKQVNALCAERGEPPRYPRRLAPSEADAKPPPLS